MKITDFMEATEGKGSILEKREQNICHPKLREDLQGFLWGYMR